MKKQDYLSIGEFADLSGVQRKNLIYYDGIQLFSPEIILENGYRYYNYRQLYTIKMILALKEVGMSLKEIKEVVNKRTPEMMIELFQEKKIEVEKEINNLAQIKDMMDLQLERMKESNDIQLGKLLLVECEAEPLFFGPDIDSCEQTRLSKGIADFFRYSKEHGYDHSYPWGIYVNLENPLRQEFVGDGNFYYHVPTSMTYKPAGTYLIAYQRGHYDTYSKIYNEMIRYIQKQGWEIVSGFYSDYVLSEISVSSPNDFLIKASIQIKQ